MLSGGVILPTSKLKRRKRKSNVVVHISEDATANISGEVEKKSKGTESKKISNDVSPGILRDNPNKPNSNEPRKPMVEVKVTRSTSENKPNTKLSKHTNTSSAASVKPSSNTLAVYRKWQQAAEDMGATGVQIVLDKSQAKKLVFDFLHDQSKPMNITDIYKALKGIVPSPVLKSCLDEMVVDPGLSAEESADCDCNERSTERCRYGLLLKEGRNSNTTLYYVDYARLENCGNGLLLDDRFKLVADLDRATALANELRGKESSLLLAAQKLELEPTNKELDAQLKEFELEVPQLTAELEYYRSLKENEKMRKSIQSKLGTFASHWKKRRRLCIDFLNTLEDCTDGAISAKQCLSGGGQIEIESDENAAKEALESAKAGHVKGKRNSTESLEVSGLTSSAQRNELVAVKLLPNGTVGRIYAD